MDCKFKFGFNFEYVFGCKVMQDETCKKCKHSLSDHHHGRVEWRQVSDKQASIDEDMKKKWKAAKDATEKTATLTRASEKVLNELNQVVSNATNDLAQLAEEHTGLSV
jgi:hypothetical protein